MTEFNDGVSRWRHVADGIRASISNGDLTERLPPETRLAEEYGVNRHTVRRAIAALQADGLLRAERGRGTFVNSQPTRMIYQIGSRARFSENLARQSLDGSARLIQAQTVPASASLARTLSCGVGDLLHRLERMAVVDGIPMSLSTSHFSAKRFPAIVPAYVENESITKALRQMGIEDYRRQETRLTAERVSVPDAQALHCASDAIVLITDAIDVDLEGRPIQTVRTRFLADRIELVFAGL